MIDSQIRRHLVQKHGKYLSRGGLPYNRNFSDYTIEELEEVHRAAHVVAWLRSWP